MLQANISIVVLKNFESSIELSFNQNSNFIPKLDEKIVLKIQPSKEKDKYIDLVFKIDSVTYTAERFFVLAKDSELHLENFVKCNPQLSYKQIIQLIILNSTIYSYEEYLEEDKSNLSYYKSED